MPGGSDKSGAEMGDKDRGRLSGVRRRYCGSLSLLLGVRKTFEDPICKDDRTKPWWVWPDPEGQVPVQ